MSRHILSVDVIPTNNPQIIHLFDTSAYVDALNTTCGRLEITLPGFRYPRLVELSKWFNLSLNAIDLEIIDVQCGQLPELPDGVYGIKYSISPNEYVFVEFNFLRTTSFEIDLFKARCALDMTAATATEDTKQKLLRIREIEDYLKSAVASVNICKEDPTKGMTLFLYAKKLLDRYNMTC